MGDFIGSTPFFIILGVILLALIGVFFYLRNKTDED
jgi:LPXTG-motif cell wall-anchored protein